MLACTAAKRVFAGGPKGKASSLRTYDDLKSSEFQTRPPCRSNSLLQRSLRLQYTAQPVISRPSYVRKPSSNIASPSSPLNSDSADKRLHLLKSPQTFNRNLSFFRDVNLLRPGLLQKRSKILLCRATAQTAFRKCSIKKTLPLVGEAFLVKQPPSKRSSSKRNPVRAVRVEDLSPAAPQPENEEAVDIKVPVGFVGEQKEQVFSVRKLLPTPSVLLTVTLPKPLGIVFEESRIRKRVVVADLLPGGNAERAARVVQMFGPPKRQRGNASLTGGAVQRGDLLRGLTTTQCIVDLFGVRAPRRATVYFDTEYRRWGEIMGAFSAVKVSDGEITLVLERKLERSQLT